jgi:predicted sulfurtransferase
MPLVRLVYASTFLSDEVEVTELKKIHESSVKNNTQNDISGMLVIGNDYFLQCIEGSREEVSRLYQKISLDKRHSHILLLNFEECDYRIFPKWNMKFLMLTEAQEDVVKKFSTSLDFNPYNMSGKSSLGVSL